jgi:hypothetical protein
MYIRQAVLHHLFKVFKILFSVIQHLKLKSSWEKAVTFFKNICAIARLHRFLYIYPIHEAGGGGGIPIEVVGVISTPFRGKSHRFCTF